MLDVLINQSYQAWQTNVQKETSFMKIIRDLHRQVDQKTDDEMVIQSLEKICHKIDVYKKLWTDYDQNWKKATDAKPLDVQYWPLIIVTLLRASSSSCHEKNLKFINTALNAIDLYERNGGNNLVSEMMTLTKKRLTTILNS